MTDEHAAEMPDDPRLLARTGAPGFFIEHAYEASFDVPVARERLWAWLNDPDTFVKGQVWPFRVEFVEGTGIHGGSGFEPGVLNVHHGPGLNVAGVIVEIDPGDDGKGRFRDLAYYYGSFALSPRLIRPTRLRFWLDDAAENGATRLRVRVDSLTRKSWAGLWTRAQDVFWKRFFRWTIRSAVERRSR
ncbi:MAG: hypothetical protein AAGD00_01475 [Planctomycetota bacterium]